MHITFRFAVSALCLALVIPACTGVSTTDASTDSPPADVLGDRSNDVFADVIGMDVDARSNEDAVEIVADSPAEIATDVPAEAAADSGCSPTSMCGGSCVDLQSDPHHCGACGTDCAALPGVDAARARCVGGICDLSTSCVSGRAHCSSNPADGCETDVTTASACGACGTACADPTPTCAMQTGGTYACTNGCPTTTPTLCGSSCVDTMGDFANCGGCGMVCPVYPFAMSTCVAGVCGRTCIAGAHECGGTCVSNYNAATCNTSCTPCPSVANATTNCDDGMNCGFRCNTGYHACGGACVTDSPATCGAACAVCAAPPNATARCDAGVCGFACDPGYARSGATCTPIPRPISPLSTGYVTARRPTLRWALAAGTDGVRVEICSDRACTTVITSFDSTATSGVPAMDLPPGLVYWRLTAMNAGVPTTQRSSTWSFTVGSRSAPVDTSWGTVLDLEGDGYADVVVGAQNAQHVFVYRGTASGVATTATLRLDGPIPMYTGRFGAAVASAGDVNGDGYADLVVGAATAPSYSGNGPGMVFVYFGSPTGIAATPSLSITGPDGDNGYFGVSVAAAGDVDRDGYGDIVVGAHSAPFTTSSGAGPGRAYLFRGGPNGPVTTPTTTLVGTGTMSTFGASVASAGDVDGDGYSDVVIGAPNAATTAGQFFVYPGGSSGLATTPSATRTGAMTNLYFGGAVACAGDTNGDGYSDIVTSATGGTFGSGTAYIYQGGASGIPAMASVTLVAPDGGGFGAAVASAGDVNGDGFSDVAIGAPSAPPGSPIGTYPPGRAYVFQGASTGLATTPSSVLTGPDAGGEFGVAIACSGDIDRDGFADIVVGAYRAGAMLVGRAHVYRGGATGTVATPSPSLDGVDRNGYFGVSVAMRSSGEHRAASRSRNATRTHGARGVTS